MRKATGGGRFDPDDRFIFFVAGSQNLNGRNATKLHRYLLVAVSDITSTRGAWAEILADPNGVICLDSGVFTLAQTHAKKHGIGLIEAFGLPPGQVDGFDDLLTAYVDLARTSEDRLWGYVEVDLGGAAVKRETRAYLEGLGLRPIPVYHPLNDGWDYLDELLDEYDRICVGNLVYQPTAVRRDVMLTISERVRRLKGPKPWVHVLGYTPNPVLLAVPFNSCDSASHTYSLQFGSAMVLSRAMTANFGATNDDGYSYLRSALAGEGHPDLDERGHVKGVDFLLWTAHADLRGWRQVYADLEEALGGPVDIFPALEPGERDVIEPTARKGASP